MPRVYYAFGVRGQRRIAATQHHEHTLRTMPGLPAHAPAALDSSAPAAARCHRERPYSHERRQRYRKPATPDPQAIVAAGLAIEQEAATAAFSPMESRRHQMWPLLTAAEIVRLQHFGTPRQWRANEYLFRTGDPAHGMVVILRGRVRVLQRDALDRASVVGEHGPGSFLAEVGQLSGKPALVDGLALEDVEAISIPPDRLRALMVAEAELGERIMRALILRRVGLIERGNGPTLLGRGSDARLLHLQAFLRRNGYPIPWSTRIPIPMRAHSSISPAPRPATFRW